MIAALADSLESVSLEEMGEAALFDRVDTKYVLPAALVPALLAEGAEQYRALAFGGRRVSRYRTEYFDTPDYTFYHDHMGGRAPRCKVRVRSYLDSNLSFLEVKWKTRRGRTVKVREPMHAGWDAAVDALRNGPQREATLRIPWASLRPSLVVDYSRLTLVSRTAIERVTIDLRLGFRADDAVAVYPGLAIAEVKQARVTRNGFTAALRRRTLREVPLSKYCLGVARLAGDRVRTNGYRRLLERMNQIGGTDDAARTDHAAD